MRKVGVLSNIDLVGSTGKLLSVILLCKMVASCTSADRDSPPAESAPAPVFNEVAISSGIDFQHINGSTGRFYYPEAYGSGVVFFDYDNDGNQDLYLVNSAELPGFVESFEPANVLYRNNGDGTFSDVTAQAGVGDTRMSTSAAFADYDADGYLDLYVANNAKVNMAAAKECRHGVVQVYCGPGQYEGVAGVLYRNEGDGTFADVTREAGMYDESGRQLGVVFSDYDLDGDVDLYIANDTTPNWLYRNDGGGVFAEIGLISGVALSPDARPEAGMGTDWGDYDRDGLMDIIVCNFQWESCRLLQNQGNGFFEDKTFVSGLGEPTYSTLTFGTDFFDYDNDG